MEKKLIAESDHRPILEEIRRLEGEAGVISAVESEMEAILLHCIQCDWGACYNTKFKELVWPYLDNVDLLNGLLRSDAIRGRSNIIVGQTGARIFPDLFHKLSRCHSSRIQEFLVKEFGRPPFD